MNVEPLSMAELSSRLRRELAAGWATVDGREAAIRQGRARYEALKRARWSVNPAALLDRERQRLEAVEEAHAGHLLALSEMARMAAWAEAELAAGQP